MSVRSGTLKKVSRILTVAFLLLPLAGCHRVKTPVSTVRMGDLAVANQLLTGFYGVEGQGANDSWRWTAPEFSLVLAPPPGARDARLLMRLYFPETQIKKLGPMTLTASIDGEPLPPETFSEAGSHDFVRDVPACFLETNLVPISFSFDTYAPHSAKEARDLAAVVLMAALEPKK